MSLNESIIRACASGAAALACASGAAALACASGAAALVAAGLGQRKK